ncbi:MAG: hypothetical protein ABIJ09_13825 [Pseudomonadota bacterium]
MENGPHNLPLALVSVDFRRAPSRTRAGLVLDDEAWLALHAELTRIGAADGLVQLATCNRVEWIAASTQPGWVAELLLRRMRDLLAGCADRPVEPLTCTADPAAHHLLGVALGLESLVQGEQQIAHQFFRAFEHARSLGCSTRVLNGLSAVAGRLLRSAERCGCQRRAARGVHTLAIELLRSLWGESSQRRVLVVGQGEIGRHARGVAEASPDLEVLVCNRTPDPGRAVLGLDELPRLLEQVDAALVCTSAATPVIDARQLSSRSAGKPLLLVDLGVPEQVSSAGLPAGVRRIGLDDLVDFGQACSAVECARTDEQMLIQRSLEQFARFCREPQFLNILEAVQAQKEWMANQGVQELVADRFGDLPQDVQRRLQQDLRHLFQRYSHGVVEAIREAADPGPYHYVDSP